MHINAGQCPAGRSRVRHKSGSGHAAQIVFSTQRARAGHRVHILTGIELAPRIVTAAQYEAEQAHIAPWLQRTMGLRIREAMPDGPLCPGAGSTPCMSYNSAYSRLVSLGRHLGITGVRTHMLRHQFASEALDANPRELANISQVLGHDSVQTTLKFYIHPSVNAEQRIGKMMNARWKTKP